MEEEKELHDDYEECHHEGCHWKVSNRECILCLREVCHRHAVLPPSRPRDAVFCSYVCWNIYKNIRLFIPRK